MSKKFIDLFAGIGGFHLAFSDLGAKCVFASELDKSARLTYVKNHDIDNFAGDINNVVPSNIPDHDILCAGFPCQPFSEAGYKKGFADTRGTLFYSILEILKTKRPSSFFLENVRHLKNHDGGKTLAIMKKEIEKVGYSFHDFIVLAKDHGVPQFRPRLFMIGFSDSRHFTPPDKRKLNITMSDILGGYCPRDIGFTLRVGGRGSNINSRHNWDSYMVNGKVKRLSIAQAAAMQGFPPDFIFPLSQTQAMKQLGNSVAVPAIRDYAKSIMSVLE